MTTTLGTIILYARDMQKSADFYRKHFGFETTGQVVEGLKFDATHQANGYAFANAKDPDKNSVSISSRAFRTATNRQT